MEPFNNENTWVENSTVNAESFVGFISLFPDKTATTLKSTVLVAYQLDSIHSNVSVTKRQ